MSRVAMVAMAMYAGWVESARVEVVVRPHESWRSVHADTKKRWRKAAVRWLRQFDKGR